MKDKTTKADCIKIGNSDYGLFISVTGKIHSNLCKLVRAINKAHCMKSATGKGDTLIEILTEFFIDELAAMEDDEMVVAKIQNMASARGWSEEAVADILHAM